MSPDRSLTSAGDVFALVSSAPAAQALRRRVEQGGVLSCDHVNPAGLAFLAAWLHREFSQRPLVLVADGLKTQERFQQDVETWLRGMGTLESPPSGATLFYPAWEILPHESRLPHVDVISERLETLMVMRRGAGGAPSVAPVVIASVVALLQRTFRPEELAARTRSVRRGDSIVPLDLVEWLEEQGYEPEAQVTEKGHIALRGGILDLWPPTGRFPARLEFFGDDLESLRFFDPLTQVSREEIPGLEISPAGELGLLRQPRGSAGIPSPAGPASTLLDYLPDGAIFLIADQPAVDEQAERYREQVPAGDPLFVSWDEFRARAEKRGLTWIEAQEGDPAAPFFPDPVNGDASGDEILRLSGLEIFRPIGDRPPEPAVAEAQRREFFSQLHRWSRQGQAVHVFCNNDGERQRFEEVWRELGFAPDPNGPPIGGRLAVHLGALSRGFLCAQARIVVVTDAEVFGRYKSQRPRRLKSPHAQTSRSLLDIDFTDLEDGDYVVHLDHGIGRFLGLKMLTNSSAGLLDGKSLGQECLVIEYAPREPGLEPPKLYVPVSEAHLVSKYVGTGRARPMLHTLGGARWGRAKAQAAVAVRDLAADMLSIQAAREAQAGHSFPLDTPWQREFEGSFVYEETPDQMKAILAVKADLERAKPMDRLICGDVGYGKTEVAIRAAFKAVMGGRQVAILVPTTVLAQQHFNTFRERMSDYPVRIELLSRYRTRREQQRVLAELAAGTVDIVIGTHRLVQPDIAFKDLGLVVIDEEQRFGVRHKEQFKHLRRLVDVLTLSATPIPRTLYLALTGARDMSTIETPPQDRLPVETIVGPFDERVIRDAIRRELNRQGQVFFLHNRVGTIDAMAARLKALLPDARILVGHGQMEADELESVMTDFVNGAADVLISTTIIESGLDIPNANTIIIDRADRFGLSELYQLRGRVGRYKHQAYAYLLLPRHAGLLADARKRLSAIKQYSSLGSGFKIAMRDLEIRGAGNLLGSEQSGHITAVGFELYCQLLRQSVSALKGEKVQARIEVTTRLDFLALNPEDEVASRPEQSRRNRRTTDDPKSRDEDIAVPREVVTWVTESTDSGQPGEADQDGPVVRTPAYVPFDYVNDARLRIEIYRRLAQATVRAELDDLKREIRDRFGPVPTGVELVLQVAELKQLAAAKQVTAIEVQAGKVKLTRHRELILVDGRFPRLKRKEAGLRLKEIKKLLLAV